MKERESQTQAFLIWIGKRLRALRKAKGYSNYELFAFDHDIPRAQYGRYEKGEDMRLSSLLKVIKALDISVKDFFSDGFDDEK